MASLTRLLFLLGAAGVPFAVCPGANAGSSSHSMYCFYTAMWDPNQAQSQVILVMYVDDQLAIKYNSSTRQAVPQAPWMEKVGENIPHLWEWNTQRGRARELRLKKELEHLKDRFNQSASFLTWQEMYACEIGENGHQEGHNQLGYNGKDFLSFDKDTLTWTAAHLEAQRIKRRWEGDIAYSHLMKFFLEKECPEYMLKFLEYGKEYLLRKEPPVVTITRKAGYDGLETLLCRAHGFYPKDIDANWKRDEEIWEQDTFRGRVVPNADGTYHTWISIEVDPKDRDRYRCHVEHDGLQEPVDLVWEDRDSVGALVGGIFGTVAFSLLVATGIILYRRNSRDTRTENPQGL